MYRTKNNGNDSYVLYGLAEELNYGGFFEPENENFLINKIKTIVLENHKINWNLTHDDIFPIMESIVYEKIETVPLMNQRVVMTCVSNFKEHIFEARKNYMLAEGFTSAVDMFDDIGKKTKFDVRTYSKGNSNPLIQQTYNSSNFYFTF